MEWVHFKRMTMDYLALKKRQNLTHYKKVYKNNYNEREHRVSKLRNWIEFKHHIKYKLITGKEICKGFLWDGIKKL